LNKLPIATVTVREGARSLDHALDDMAQAFRMGPWTRMRHVILPQLAPYLAAAARSGLSLVWKIVLIVELLGRPNGVGFEIGVAFQLFDVTRILAYALAFIAVMLAIETFLVQPLERHVARWRPRPACPHHQATVFSRCLRREAPGARRACVQPRQWAGRRAGRAIRLRQDHAAADRRGARPRFRGRRGAARAWHARHGVPGA